MSLEAVPDCDDSMLVQVADMVWVHPPSIAAIIPDPDWSAGTMIILKSGQTASIPGMLVSQVVEVLERVSGPKAT